MNIDLLVFSFFISFAVCVIIIRIFDSHKNSFLSDTEKGPQKFHTRPTPRVGGACIFISVGITIFAVSIIKHNNTYIYYIIAVIPAFIGGFLEDITKKMSVSARLSMTMLSALLGIFFLSAVVNRVDIYPIDNLFKVETISVLFTIFAASGVTNSFNIIDGYNGLSSVVSLLILMGLLYVSYKTHDTFLISLCFIFIGSIVGFFIWNYPFGKIFLGDGGAYLIGFGIAEISIILINKHHNVSAWFPLLLVIYPVFETIFSIYRKKFIKSMSPGQPDHLHLHMLIYERVVPYFYNINRNDKLLRNSATSPFLWLVCSIGVIPAIIFWDNTPALMFSALIFVFVYLILYRSIVKFKLGKFLR